MHDEAYGRTEMCLLEDALVELLPRFGPPLKRSPSYLKCGFRNSRSHASYLPNRCSGSYRICLRMPSVIPRKAGSLSIEGAIDADGRIRIAVSDTGEGVAEQERERIFDRFYRTDRSADVRAEARALGFPSPGRSCCKPVVRSESHAVKREAAPSGSPFRLRSKCGFIGA